MWGRIKCALGFHIWYRPRLGEAVTCRRCRRDRACKAIGALLLVLALAGPAPAWAGPIVMGGSSTWNAAGGADFWANPSYDRNGFAHVGIFLTGAAGSDVPGFYDHSPYLTNLVYLGGGSTTFAWEDEWAPVELLRVSDWRAVDRLERLSDGVLQFTTPAGVWRSDTLDGGRSHFALFRAEGYYYLGLEDATWTTRRPADWDYQRSRGSRYPNLACA